jgi:hypothetical protein
MDLVPLLQSVYYELNPAKFTDEIPCYPLECTVS